MTLEISIPGSYRRRLSTHRFGQIVADVADLVATLEVRGPELLGHARTPTRDGYPTSVRYLPGSRGSSGSTIPEALAIEAVEKDETDPTRALAIDMCEALLVARDILRRAHGAWEQSVPPRRLVDDVAELGGRSSSVPSCVHCGDPALPRPKAGRCERCYKYRLRHEGQDRPLGGDVGELDEAA